MKKYQPLLLGAVLLWLVVVVSGYYFYHKPLAIAQAVALVRAVGQFAAALALTSAAGGLGARLFPGDGLHPLTRLALQAALGLGLLGLGVLILGSIVGLQPIVWWILLGLLLILNGRVVGMWMKNWLAARAIWQDSGQLGRILAVGVGVLLLATLIVALAPPLKFDTLVYHLAFPRAYLDAGRVIYLPESMLWGMPQLAEMLFTWAMLLAGAESAMALGWCFGVLALAGTWGYIAPRFGARAAWVAVAALLAGYSSATSLAWGYVGWLMVLLGLAFLVILADWRSTDDSRALVMTGIFAGLSLGAKYTAGVLVLIGLGVIVWTARKALLQPPSFPRMIEKLLNILLFGGVASLVSAPWWIKNALATGNPVYPFFFQSGAMNAFRLTLQQNQPPWGNWQDLVLLPLRATWTGAEGAPGYSASIGPLLLAFGALAWIGYKARSQDQRGILGVATLVAVLGLALWAAAARFSGLLIQTRMYWSLFPAFALLTAAGFDAVERLRFPQVRTGRIAGVFVALVLWLNVFQVGVSTIKMDAPSVVLGILERDEYRLNNLGGYAWAVDSVAKLPAEARVLMLWEPRSFACLPQCIPDETLDRWHLDRNAYENSTAIAQSWRAAGYTHVLYFRLGADFTRASDERYQPEDWLALDQLLAGIPVVEHFGEGYTLYALELP